MALHYGIVESAPVIWDQVLSVARLLGLPDYSGYRLERRSECYVLVESGYFCDARVVSDAEIDEHMRGDSHRHRWGRGTAAAYYIAGQVLPHLRPYGRGQELEGDPPPAQPTVWDHVLERV